jgi:hypothetical protein
MNLRDFCLANVLYILKSNNFNTKFNTKLLLASSYIKKLYE